MRVIASHCVTSLRSVKVGVDDNSHDVIQSLCRACPNLGSLSLWNFSLGMKSDGIIDAVVQHCPLIESISAERWQLSDISLNALANINTLKQLRLSAYGYTSTAVQHVLRANSTLRVLNVGSVDEALVKCIGSSCRHLNRLKLGDDTHPAHCNGTLLDLFRGCPLLESFVLFQHGGMSSAALRTLFDNCHCLTELKLVFTQPNEPSLVAEPVLHAHFPSLTKLWVANNGVADSALRDIFTYCTNLRDVLLHSCKQLSDETLTALTQNCRRLYSFYLVDCRSITIAGLVAMATQCTSLAVLDLFFMPVTDEVLLQLSLSCKSLTRLILWECLLGPITETGIGALAEACTRLSSFTIRSSMLDSITPILGLATLRQRHPRVEFYITSGR